MSAPAEERPVAFDCAGARLLGILHEPASPCRRGVVVVTGGPQYRIGSHRQFLLLARDLAAAGFPVLRFDYRGMGDSDGDFAGFENAGEDIRAAVDTLFDEVPGLQEVALWGLCDGASAISFYAASDDRVTGIALVNPWVRSDGTLAQAQITGHYAKRILSRGLWLDLLRGRISPARSLGGLARTLVAAVKSRRPDGAQDEAGLSLPQRVSRSLRRFSGRTLVILSGQDMTATEFDGAVLKRIGMSDWVNSETVTVRRLAPANHTYSTSAYRRQVHLWTREWLERDTTPGHTRYDSG